MNKDGIFIDHGIFNPIVEPGKNNPTNRKGDGFIPLPNKFRSLLMSKFMKFGEAIEFTYGICPDEHVAAIAIVHPKDNFCRKIGCKIVRGRINRMLQRGRFTDKPYNKPYPRWIYKLER